MFRSRAFEKAESGGVADMVMPHQRQPIDVAGLIAPLHDNVLDWAHCADDFELLVSGHPPLVVHMLVDKNHGHRVAWDSMEYHETPWNSRSFHRCGKLWQFAW